ncbi:unnamed protein product [Dibothriocephalus latus]|uniref:Uncharacterized protein n=1 Tax=Dibothriocephalus latus TaxID=60516 RepID=A0A3P7LK86_DIBLA|nr:unnamed protein product [Dibothriocephalus latus]
MRGAKTGNARGSDHILVHTRLMVHLSSAPQMPRTRRLDVAKLRQPNISENSSPVLRPKLTVKEVASGHHGRQASMGQLRKFSDPLTGVTMTGLADEPYGNDPSQVLQRCFLPPALKAVFAHFVLSVHQTSSVVVVMGDIHLRSYRKAHGQRETSQY